MKIRVVKVRDGGYGYGGVVSGLGGVKLRGGEGKGVRACEHVCQ